MANLATLPQDFIYRRAEAALRESEQKFRNIIVNSVDGIYLANEEGFMIEWNPAMVQITGVPRHEALGQTIWDIRFRLVPDEKKSPEVYAKLKTRLLNLIQTGKFKRKHKLLVLDIQHRDGTRRALQKTTFPISTSKGFMVSSILHDVTEIKRVEDALRESEESYRALAENANDGIAIVKKNTLSLYSNQRLSEITGYSEKELCGKRFINLLHPAEQKKAREQHMKMRHQRTRPRILERLLVHKDGTLVPVEISSSHTTWQGEKARVYIIRDVTERKQAERLLQEKNEALRAKGEELMTQRQELLETTRALETASQFKSQFLAGMSHELRTPLNAIIGFSQLLLDGIPGDINDTQRQCLTDVLNSSQYLLTIINDVLDLSKVEAGKLDLHPERLNLREFIRELEPTVEMLLKAKGQRLKTNIEDGLPEVKADVKRLRQIMLNLLSNATKFTPPAGNITVEAVSRENVCQTSVIDSGIGIRKEDQARVFEAFTQLETPPEVKKAGTGLGLTITRKLVKMSGGQLWLESEPGKGSKFTFTLPFADNQRDRG